MASVLSDELNACASCTVDRSRQLGARGPRQTPGSSVGAFVVMLTPFVVMRQSGPTYQATKAVMLVE